MQRRWAIAIGLMFLGTAAGIYSAKALHQHQQVQQLLETKACVGCDLRGVNLAGIDLSHSNLERANLQGANLQNTKLGFAQFQEANLQNANLEGADLGCATVRFDLNSNDTAATARLNVDEAQPQPTQGNILNFSFSSNPDGATMQFNLWGCSNFQGATLTGARLPNGSIYASKAESQPK